MLNFPRTLIGLFSIAVGSPYSLLPLAFCLPFYKLSSSTASSNVGNMPWMQYKVLIWKCLVMGYGRRAFFNNFFLRRPFHKSCSPNFQRNTNWNVGASVGVTVGFQKCYNIMAIYWVYFVKGTHLENIVTCVWKKNCDMMERTWGVCVCVGGGGDLGCALGNEEFVRQ